MVLDYFKLSFKVELTCLDLLIDYIQFKTGRSRRLKYTDVSFLIIQSRLLLTTTQMVF